MLKVGIDGILGSWDHICIIHHTGLGSTQPDPAGTRVLDGGVEVPMGTSSASGVSGTSLLYNEYPLF